MPIKQENWDGVTAPAIPSNWTVDTGLTTTAIFSGGITPTSSPNALTLAVGNNTPRFATWGTADTNNGDTTVQVNCNASGISNNLSFGLFLRCNVNAAIQSSSTFYRFFWGLNTNQAIITKVVAGVSTTLSALNVVSISAPLWYQITFTASGSTITASVQRMTDGFWLNSSGNFQSGQTNSNSATDSAITGAGFAGLLIQARTDFAYADDWLFENAAPVALTPYMKPIQSWIRGPLFTKVYG